MYIAAGGKLLPCIPLTGLPIQDTMPNINDMSIADALSNSTYIKAVNATLKDLFDANAECGSCEYRLYCGGGCRAGALIGGQSYLGKQGFILTTTI